MDFSLHARERNALEALVSGAKDVRQLLGATPTYSAASLIRRYSSSLVMAELLGRFTAMCRFSTLPNPATLENQRPCGAGLRGV